MGTGGKPGRPVGYVVSDKTKMLIGKSKVGRSCSQQTRDKISAGLIKYFKKLNPLSDEMLKKYGKLDVDGEILKFIAKNAETLDSFDNILTERKLRNIAYYEDEIKDWGYTCVPDTITPELLIILKEEVEDKQEEEE